MEKGKFIVIEGGEGAGKGICIQYIKDKLNHLREFGVYNNDAAYNTIFTREPGGTAVSEKIREILMSNKMLPLTELFLFCGARAQHIGELIAPALKAGKNVICDRFSYSTIAYQIYGRYKGGELAVYNQLNYIATEGLNPDIVIYLDVYPSVGLERKAKSKDGHCTRFDSEKLEFHEMVRSGYLDQYQIAREKKGEPTPVWLLIETNHVSEQEVKDRVWNIIKQILNINFN